MANTFCVVPYAPANEVLARLGRLLSAPPSVVCFFVGLCVLEPGMLVFEGGFGGFWLAVGAQPHPG